MAVSNVAVFNSVTNRYVPIALKLGDESSEVWDIAPYGGTGNVLIAGEFSGPSSKEGNLLLVDGKSGKVIPNEECQTRKGIAAYSFDGQLAPNWAPQYSGNYHLVWELHVEGSTLHTGGQFKKVSGVIETSYARLSPASSL